MGEVSFRLDEDWNRLYFRLDYREEALAYAEKAGFVVRDGLGRACFPAPVSFGYGAKEQREETDCVRPRQETPGLYSYAIMPKARLKVQRKQRKQAAERESGKRRAEERA